MDDLKTCGRCKETKTMGDFHKTTKTKDGVQWQCKACDKLGHAARYLVHKEKIKAQNDKYKLENKEKLGAAAKEWKKNNPDKVKKYQRISNLRTLFGIEVEDYERMLKDQDGKCAICRQPETFIHHQTNEIANLAVDHCHTTGNIRKLLCKSCNNGLGLFKENIDSLINAIQYLKDHNGRP